MGLAAVGGPELSDAFAPLHNTINIYTYTIVYVHTYICIIFADIFHLYHDAWVDERYRHSICSPYTPAQPFIFPYTLGCMVARTTNASAVANGPPTVWETLAD